MKVTDKEENTQTDERVKNLRRLLDKAEIDRNVGKSYFEIVINPDSFTQTIENMFDFSFLVKEGYVELSPGEDDIPMVIPGNPEDIASQQENVKGLVSAQTVLSLNKRQWESIVRRYNIKKSFIATRKPVGDDTA